MSTLAVYNRQRAVELLRDWTPERLLHEVRHGRFGAQLSAAEVDELSQLVQAWTQRALGPLTLRDALLVDPRRGARVYDLICTTLTVTRYRLPADAAQAVQALDTRELMPQQVQAALSTVSSESVASLQPLLRQAERTDYALVYHPDDRTASYPMPANLEALLPTLPPLYPHLSFEQPIGWRRTIALLLAFTGMSLLIIPVLLGQLPQQPAGIPLALLTLALMVGIHASWPGYVGAMCIWLVANLPGFRYGTVFLWPAIPLLVAGLVLLSLDRRVRAMWRWIRRSWLRAER